MKIRDYVESDLPRLKEIHSEAGYQFPFPDLSSPLIGHVKVLVDDEDFPLMAVCSKLVPEVILLCAPGGEMHPLMKLKGIGMIHEAMRKELEPEYDEAFCFVPPEIEKSYGNHLRRKFGWLKTWAGFRIGRTR